MFYKCEIAPASPLAPRVDEMVMYRVQRCAIRSGERCCDVGEDQCALIVGLSDVFSPSEGRWARPFMFFAVVT